MASSDEEVEVGLLSADVNNKETTEANSDDIASTELLLTDKIEEIPNSELNNPTLTNDNDEESGQIESKASLITQIMVPVSITMALVIAIVKTLHFQWQDTVSQAMVYAENPNDPGITRFFQSLKNALVFVGMIIVVTVIFVVLYKYRCLKLIFGWLILSTGIMLGLFGGYLAYSVLVVANIPMDYITFAFLIWNFAIVGNISIFWHAPIKVNQAYLIAISVILAVAFTRLPEWTTWTILGAIAIYDLFAVLCPKGPLRVLLETAQERDEPIPALIYNTSIIMMMGSQSDDEEGGQAGIGLEEPQREDQTGPRRQDEDEEDEKPQTRGVKLGLGDFVFYSVLVGRAALFDMLTVFVSFIGIVTGLFCTILLLAIWRKALPALPISIAFGILFFFLGKIFLYPFMMKLAEQGYVV